MQFTAQQTTQRTIRTLIPAARRASAAASTAAASSAAASSAAAAASSLLVASRSSLAGRSSFAPCGMTSSSASNFFARRTPSGAGAASMHSSAAASSASAVPRSSPGRLSQLFNPASASSWAFSDLRAYHDGYPGQRQSASSSKNLLFYTNKIASVPSGAKIDVMHATWFGQHDLLEAHHGYIQWIFPIREDGMNSQSQMLMLHEIAALKQDPAFPKRLLASYRLMLDFYGMQLADPLTGRVTRGSNYRARYAHLNRSSHNYLRITRILKCLGELGQEHLKLGFLLLVVRELTLNEFKAASVGRSAINYWFPTLRSPSDRARLQSVLDELVAAESAAAAAADSKEVTLSEQRIVQVLEEAQAARARNSQRGSADEDGEDDDAIDDDAAASSNASAVAAASGAAASSLGFVSESDSDGDGDREDRDTDSPRADAEAMAVSRTASSEADKGQTVAAAAASSSSSAAAASPTAAAAAAAVAAPPATLLSKRKSVDGSEEADGGMVDDSPRAKKAQSSPSNAANGQQHANGKAQ